jgi:hypothetical protein
VQFNLALLAEKGANLCGEDRFSIEMCERCDGQYLYNDELKDVYFDPDDLARRFFKLAAMPLPPCRYCGALDWQFQARPDAMLVQAGPWACLLTGRQYTFS